MLARRREGSRRYRARRRDAAASGASIIPGTSRSSSKRAAFSCGGCRGAVARRPSRKGRASSRRAAERKRDSHVSGSEREGRGSGGDGRFVALSLRSVFGNETQALAAAFQRPGEGPRGRVGRGVGEGRVAERHSGPCGCRAAQGDVCGSMGCFALRGQAACAAGRQTIAAEPRPRRLWGSDSAAARGCSSRQRRVVVARQRPRRAFGGSERARGKRRRSERGGPMAGRRELCSGGISGGGRGQPAPLQAQRE